MMKVISYFITVAFLSVTCALDCVYHKYCVVGAGPGGLQMGYFLQVAKRDYILFEATNKTGSFFEKYPRHRKLISINKRHTGKLNVEFNLRHDWNSLLSHNDDLRVTKYSKELFPNADVLLNYLKHFQRKLNIPVQFNTTIRNIHKVADEAGGQVFRMKDQRKQCYECRILILATGISTPTIIDMSGIGLAIGYETVSIDPKDYEGKSVLILGRGNSGFEMASSIYGATNHVHLVSRSRAKLAWSTHYVGDLRAVNNELLDSYQLKSLDAMLEIDSLRSMTLTQKGDKIYFEPDEEFFGNRSSDNSALRVPYDVVIRALGFTFDNTVFRNRKITQGDGHARKYPKIQVNYESVDHNDLYYAGTVSHSLDFRKSAGGFIHGFRYTVRALHRLLEWQYEGIPWPSVTIPASQLLKTIFRRINEGSGIYQMFQNLGDIAVLSEDGKTVTYIEEFPVNALHQLFQRSGINASSVLVILLEYGKRYSGPAVDVFKYQRATINWWNAHTCNFLHPIIYYYKNLPTEKMMLQKTGTLPRPDKIHHIVEDFHTLWDAPFSHILPLRRFLEEIWQTDHRTFFSQMCFQLVMTLGTVPDYCAQEYLKGRGLVCTKEMWQKVTANI